MLLFKDTDVYIAVNYNALTSFVLLFYIYYCSAAVYFCQVKLIIYHFFSRYKKRIVFFVFFKEKLVSTSVSLLNMTNSL